MARTLILVAVSIALGLTALLLWKSALDDIGGFELARRGSAGQLVRLFGQWEFWLGVPALVGVTVITLDLWSTEDLSRVVPLYSVSYIAVALLGKLRLGEDVTPQRWLGITAVVSGVLLIAWS